jgi:hypothetical protein
LSKAVFVAKKLSDLSISTLEPEAIPVYIVVSEE